MTEQPSSTFTCLNCQVGQKHSRRVTFITWIGKQMITVPDFPAWVCDICHHRTYDRQAIAQLSLVLDPNAGTPVNRPHHPPSVPPSQSAPPII